ncbi:MAG: metallophosphoesterase, partial [Nanoarchaeota archaeon]|nr:metallophosphoesterase [Nanoarchaeota archaeon]
GLCDRTIPKGTPENVQCHKDNTRSHGHIPWEFFKDWFPRLYPPTLPAPTASIQIQPGLAAGAVPQPGAAPGAQPSGIAQQQGFRFIVFTDSHTRVPPSEIQKKLVKRMIELKPDLIISGGDMVSGVDGITAEEIAEHWGNFDELIRPIRDAGIPFLPSAGNHDKAIGGEVVEAAYNNKWSSYVVPGLDNFEGRFDAYYSFDHKNAHFVILDASRINLGNEQYAWLESDLNKAKESENIFVVGHVPLTRAREGVREDHVVPESKIRPVLKEANIKAYLAGHNHVYNELDVDGIKQISCGFSEYMKGGSIPLGGTEEQKQEDQSFVVFDVVGSTFTYYVVLGPDFTTTVDGREIPAEAPSAQAAEVLPAGGIPLAGTPPTASGFEGLYDIFFTSEAGNLVLRAIARYPIGMGVQAPTLESIVSLTPQTITPAAPTTAAAGAPAGVAAPAPTAIPPGTESGANLKCHYCSQAKAYIQQLYPEEYQACLSSNDICCEATCPQGSVIKSGVPYINQARAAMGEGGDCWHDGIPPDRPAGSTAGEDYGGSACGVAALRMALKGHGIDVSSKDLFCGSPQGSHTIFLISGGGETGGSGPGMMVNAAKALGRPETKFSNVVDWNDIVSSIKQGKVVIFYIGDRTKIGHGGVVQERCYTSVGHYIVLLGASDNFVIANDPGGHCGATGAERMVLSKTFIEGTARGYFVI